MRQRLLTGLLAFLVLGGGWLSAGYSQEKKDAPPAAASAPASDPVGKLTTQIGDLEKALKTLSDETTAKKGELDAAIADAKVRGDTAWMLVSSALVLLMVPGLALSMVAWCAGRMCWPR